MSTEAQKATRRARVGIIGTGFAGLGMAIRLRQTGVDDFILMEKGDRIGGTWRDNDYPGCACDVPSNLYSYSFAPNPEWTTTFAHQPEILDYTNRVVAEYDLLRSTHLNTFVQDARWDADAQRWQVETSQGPYEFDVLVSATGPLSAPSIPNIPGLADFEGPVFHSAEWDHSVDLKGKRVAVIGTGASAIQFVPEIQKEVSELKLFQRTPPWLLPRPEYATSKLRRSLFRRFPILQKLGREYLYWGHEAYVIGFTRFSGVMKLPQLLAQRHLRSQIKDPALREKVTPNFTIGCKRILLSSNYYPALAQPNVEVIASGVSAIGKGSVTSSSGEEREVDAIVLGTGFHVTDIPIAEHVRGAAGTTLAEEWKGSMQAYRGATVSGFPNFFFVLGPNTGLGHSSMIFMVEASVQYVIDALQQMDQHGIAQVDVRPERYRRWNQGIQRRMPDTIWVKGGCASWYLDANGRNTTLWPDFTFRYRALTKRFDLESYTTLPRREAAEPATEPTPATA
ncbi:MAG: NAD(P)/FAD-dependent oxidoreductase [Solirubrobacteraceae bacterium]|nr:NAD(P)/FAD-dependent oxidoreductase [Solirubrobacteraceae bacterium]